MEFTVSRHADKLVMFFLCNCLSFSPQVRREPAEICSVAFMAPIIKKQYMERKFFKSLPPHAIRD